jgi:hypothetical protein
MEERLLSARDVAFICGVGRSHASVLMRTKMDHILLGKSVRVTREALDAYLASVTVRRVHPRAVLLNPSRPPDLDRWTARPPRPPRQLTPAPIVDSKPGLPPGAIPIESEGKVLWWRDPNDPDRLLDKHGRRLIRPRPPRPPKPPPPRPNPWEDRVAELGPEATEQQIRRAAEALAKEARRLLIERRKRVQRELRETREENRQRALEARAPAATAAKPEELVDGVNSNPGRS